MAIREEGWERKEASLPRKDQASSIFSINFQMCMRRDGLPVIITCMGNGPIRLCPVVQYNNPVQCQQGSP